MASDQSDRCDVMKYARDTELYIIFKRCHPITDCSSLATLVLFLATSCHGDHVIVGGAIGIVNIGNSKVIQIGMRREIGKTDKTKVIQDYC